MGVELFGAAEASLLEHYLDTVEHLPDDVQRTISLLREIDQKYQRILAELEQLIRLREPKKRDIHRALVRTQELSDEKLQLMQQLVDTIENKSRQLESDARTLDKLSRHHNPATTFSDCLAKERLYDSTHRGGGGGTLHHPPLSANSSGLAAGSHSSDDSSNQNIPSNNNISGGHSASHHNHHSNLNNSGPHPHGGGGPGSNSGHPNSGGSAGGGNGPGGATSNNNSNSAVGGNGPAGGEKGSGDHHHRGQQHTISNSNNLNSNSSVNNHHSNNGGSSRHAKEENSQSSTGTGGGKRARRAAAKDYSETSAYGAGSESVSKREKRSGAGTNQTSAKGNKRGGTNTENSATGQGKKRKSARQQEAVSPVDAIDPDEPTYCLCEQVSFGEMIGCDNEECAIEWFHFQCVALTTKPKGKWYCPRCRGDRSNQMKKAS